MEKRKKIVRLYPNRQENSNGQLYFEKKSIIL